MLVKIVHALKIFCTAFIFFATQNIYAQASSSNERPKTLENLIICGTIKDDKKRLACYDKNIQTFQSAEATGEIIIADKKTVDKAREDIFGLKASDNPLFTGKNGTNLKQIETVIKSARTLSNNKWILTLENGSKWQQTDTVRLRYKPKSGYDIIIKKSAGGGFKANIKGQRFIKVKRIN